MKQKYHLTGVAVPIPPPIRVKFTDSMARDLRSLISVTGKRSHSACLVDPGKYIYATDGQLVDTGGLAGRLAGPVESVSHLKCSYDV